MARHPYIIFATLLLLKVISISSQQTENALQIQLDDIEFVEGRPANEEVVSIQHRGYPSDFVTFRSVQGIQRNVFDMYFHYSDNGRTMYTSRIISRDDIALALRRPHSPVSFIASFFVVNVTNQVAVINVNIRITDMDNNVPVFIGYENRSFHLPISEGSIGSSEISNVGIHEATDNDEGVNTVQNYTLMDSIGGLFSLEVRRDDAGFIDDIRLVLNSVLDRETRAQYSLVIVAREGNENPDSATLMVNITVTDVCDEPPRFPVSRYFPEIEENSPEDTTIFPNITAVDLDILDNINYEISEVCSHIYEDTPPCVPVAESDIPFNLDQETGALTINQVLDREEFAQYEITILAVDNCGSAGTAMVVVTVTNVNDNAPSVTTIIGDSFVQEGTSVGTSTYFLSVQDPDYGRRSGTTDPRFTFQLHDNSTGVLMDTELFELDRDSLQIRLTQSLDREDTNEYMLVLNVTDWGTPNMSTILQLPINVVDINDNTPEFDPIAANYDIIENAILNTRVVTVHATDRDSFETGNGRVSYKLPDNSPSYPYQDLFYVDTLGRLIVNGTLDREQQESLSVLVQAEDNPNENSGDPRSDFIVVNITLIDVNDTPPTILTPPEVVNIPESHAINTVVFTATASDNDTEQYSTLHYTLTPNSAPFRINSTSGSVTLVSSLDYDTITSYTLTLRVTDGGLEDSRTITVMVGDVNDERCMFDRNGPYMDAVFENRPENFHVINVSAVDRDTPPELLTYRIESGNEDGSFRIEPSTGEIFTTRSLDHDVVSNYTLIVSCNDGSGIAVTTTVFLRVADENDNFPQFINQPYNFTVSENLPENTYVNRVEATDSDSTSNGIVRYCLLGVTPSSVKTWFRLDENTGDIHTTRILDREAPELANIPNGQVMLNIEAFDMPTNGSGPLFNTSLAYIEITDRNDQIPTFDEEVVTITLPENYAIGSLFDTVIQATDLDIFPNNQIEYEISGRSPSGTTDRFSINRETGALRLLQTLDYETQDRHEFEVLAIDSTLRNHQDTQMVVIIVQNVAENNITIVGFMSDVSINENVPSTGSYVVTQFTVTDINQTPLLVNLPRLRYTIVNMDPSSPTELSLRNESTSSMLIVYVSAPIDRENPSVGNSETVVRYFNITVYDPDTSDMSHGSVSAVLTVTINDENDNRPQFGESPYTFTIRENNDVTVPIGQVTSTDIDYEMNGTPGIMYEIPESVPFTINDEGEISSTEILDRDTIPSYEFMVIARDGATPPMSSSVQVIVNVLDQNDNDPEFDSRQNRTFVVGEETSVNTIVANLSVFDRDDGLNGQVNLSLADMVNRHFHLDPNGSIILVQSLDREETPQHSFTVVATDGKGRWASADVVIVVQDYNDNPPVFSDIIIQEGEPVSTIIIQEDKPLDVVFATVMAEDADQGRNSVVRYAIGNYSLQQTFCINQNTGDISLCNNDHAGCGGVVDYERQGEYDVSIVAYDLGTPRHIVSKNVRIVIRPINEYPPLFDRDLLIVYHDEAQSTGVEVARIRAIDMDKDDQITYTVIEDNVTSLFFGYDLELGGIVTNGVLDYESKPRYDLTLLARDTNNSMSHMEVVVVLNNINDHAPIFDPQTMPNTANQPITVSETVPISTVVWTVRATDEDNATHDAVSYHLRTPDSDNHFTIDSLTGEIIVSQSLDFETRNTYTLEVYAEDTGEPQLTSTVITMVIDILNENDESPIFTSNDYSFSVQENLPAGTTFGEVSAPDDDFGTYGEVRYSISGGSEYFGIDPESGDIFTLEVLDREALAGASPESMVSFVLSVEASDGGSGLTARHASADVVVTVADVNDNAPQFSEPQYLIRIPPTQVTGVLTTLPVSDPDENGNNAHSFEIDLPLGNVPLAVSDAGNVILMESVPSAYLPVYIYTVTVTDDRDRTLRSQAKLELIIETGDDHHPVFDPVVSMESVSELTDLHTVIFRVQDVVSDQDSGTNGRLSYAFAENYPKFAINESSGDVTLREQLDYEDTREYSLTVLATDSRLGGRRTATGTVRVTVVHGNEYAPEFIDVPSQLTISHLPQLNLEIYTVSADDRDEGTDGDVRFNLYDSTEVFSIDRESGILTNQGIQNSDGVFNLTIGAYDRGNPFRSSNTTILIVLQNGEEDSRPIFVENPMTITHRETDTIDGYLNAPLVTNPQAQSYHIAKQTVFGDPTPIEMFDIVPGDGRLSLLAPLDYEETRQYSLVIEARIEATTGSTVQRKSDYLQVNLVVANVNDNVPLFSTVANQLFSESTEVNTLLFNVLAVDDDEGSEGVVNYDIIRGDSAETFRINQTTGQVFLNRPLDRETVSAYDLVIRAHDSTNQPQTSEITVHVTVVDENDFATTYGGVNFSLGVYEYPHTGVRDRIVKLAATDEDEGPPLRYELELIEAYTQTGMPVDVRTIPTTFDIDPDTGVIFVVDQTLNREVVERYTLHITATDRVHNAETYLTINILDVNDHTPDITFPPSIIHVWEGQPAGTLVTDLVNALDADTGINSWVKYSLIGNMWPSEFSIDPLSGVIRTNDVIIARENNLSFQGTVMARDQGFPYRTSTTSITIVIVDVNDHPPEFGQDSIVLSHSITDPVNTVIYDFNVTDRDFTLNASPFMFSIPGYYSEVLRNFGIGAGNGVLTLLERQTRVRSYNFVIHASNSGYSPRCAQFTQASTIDVTVNVRPVNTGCPEFSRQVYRNDVTEETTVTGSLVTVSTSDPDDGDTVVYSIANAALYPFQMDPQSGALTLTRTLDRERNASYSLTVVATDDGFPTMSCFATVEITVLDINDHAPVFRSEAYTGTVDENLPVNSLVRQVSATDVDLDEAARVTYSIEDGLPFRIDASSGEIFTTQTLDYESLNVGSYSFMVTASDHGTPPLSTQVGVTISVNDVNEVGPMFESTSTTSFIVDETSGRGDLIDTVRASDRDGNATLVYSFAHPVPTCYFSLNNISGEIRLKVSADDAPGSCADGVPIGAAQDPQYFTLEARAIVSDGKFMDSVPLSFTLHNSLCVTCREAVSLPVEVIAASITGALAVIFVFVCILIFACICRARRTAKIRINDTPGQTGMELHKRFGSGRSSTNNTPGPIYKQTSILHEHTTMTIPHSTGSGASSTRQSYVCGDADTDQNDRIAYPSPGVISRKSQLTKPYRSTSDLGSSMAATDMLSGESQEPAPYPKAQIEKIYAKNADLLNQSDSNESIHMFGSEGGGESDGGDDMLFAKFNDLDDDDDSTTMQDDEDDRNYQQRSLSNSRDDLNVPPVMDDPYTFDHPSSIWAPRVANNMVETIEQMAMNSYEPDEHMRRGQHYMNEFNKSQEGVSMYGASTQESTRPLLRHAHPQQRMPPQHMMQPSGPEFYPYEEHSPNVRLHDHHGNTRAPKYGPTTGLPMYPAHNIPRGHGRHEGGASQEVYGYGDYMHHHPMHLGGNHSPSSSTPTEGTLNTRATTNDYESDLMYSSDTSLNTNTEDPPHLRGFSQSGHSQRHGYH